ncbi:MAG: TonB-dependent receptor [Bacteroidetes bacterium]|nr:TonB-dependent receptor [Bacteroidota bacterium]
MNKFYKISFVLILLLVSNLITAQEFKVFGTVSDATTKEKLIGANVYIADLNTGAATNTEGSFSIDNVKEGTYEVAVTYIGYLRLVKNIKVSKNQRFDFVLEPSSVLLEETVVKGTKAVLRETPVAFSEVKGEEIEFKLASRDIPQELATAPSVYSSVQGGASGDATLFVRGFSQRNVAVMINGVPVNDMENKWVYWSNWAGLGDVLDNTQIQRGIGASPYSVSAVGGVMNMVTKGVATEQEFIKVRSEYGTNNLIKGSAHCLIIKSDYCNIKKNIR